MRIKHPFRTALLTLALGTSLIVPTLAGASVAAASTPSAPSSAPINPVAGSVEYTATGATGALALTSVANPAGCTLSPSVVYLRASSGYGAVGAKPYTQCAVPVTSIHQDVRVYKDTFFGWSQQGITFPGGNSGVANYTQLNVEVWCTNWKSTTWMAQTDGTIVYLGVTYTAYVQTPPPDPQILCGT
jgi:hypothetical protein